MNVIELCSLVENGRCGYCQKRGSKTSLGEDEDDEIGKSVSLGIWAHDLTTSAYQELLDCGMRRSGLYVYKPIMERTCCPQYTIRLDTLKFFLSRNQKRVLRAMSEYLKNGVRPKCGPVQEMDIDQLTKDLETMGKKSSKKSLPSVKDRVEGLPIKKKNKRRQRCYEKWRSKGLDIEELRNKRKQKEEARRRTTDSFLEPYESSWKHSLEIQLVKTGSDEFEERREESFLLFKKYQTTIHLDQDVTKAGFKRFLVSNPFEKNQLGDSMPQFGAYHQWYILDGKLIAVGVVDVLPHCLSSKYMYYDPDFSFLSLGTYTALREIEFTRKLSMDRPGLKYYYMGYYIQSCPKMRYKGKFQPSELLCDKSFDWVPLSDCQKMFAAVDSPYVTFRPNNTAPRKTIQDLILLVKQRPIRYTDLPSIIPGFEAKESQKVRSTLTLLASLLPALPLRRNLLIFVGEIETLANEKDENTGDSDND